MATLQPHVKDTLYANVEFKNSLTGHPISQFHFVEYPKWTRAYDAEGKQIAEKLVNNQKEELDFLQSGEAQPEITKVEEENTKLATEVAELKAQIAALMAAQASAAMAVKAPATVAPVVTTEVEDAKARAAAKVAAQAKKYLPEGE